MKKILVKIILFWALICSSCYGSERMRYATREKLNIETGTDFYRIRNEIF